VCDSKTLPLVFKNTGKYPVSYAFTLRNAQVRANFCMRSSQCERVCRTCLHAWTLSPPPGLI